MFACARCAAELTVPVSRVVLPVHSSHHGHDMLPALMESGTYAVDPEPSGPPWRPWHEVGAAEAAARGVFAPVSRLSFGAPGAIVVAPGDTRGTVLIPERCAIGCLGLDGRDGPNLACVRCGLEVATRLDDCSYWQAVRFQPRAVRRLPVDGPVRRPAYRDARTYDRRGTPPVDTRGMWDLRWEAAAGAALAHLVAASAGMSVALLDGPVAATFGRALGELLPAGPPVRRAALVGPGLPGSDREPDIALVPRHPDTGVAWQSFGTAHIVPVVTDVWMRLAFHRDPLRLPATGRMPDGVLPDDPLPPHPWRAFRPDFRVFLHTLSRLPAVRQPWLRGIYDRVWERTYRGLPRIG